MRAGLVTWLILVHTAAILLFSRGFLLNRLALSDISNAISNPQERPRQTHTRAVVLIIDALRFDFVSPNPPEPHNKYHHNVLTLPAQLTEQRPEHSFLFNAFADPPTTTLQRIKALTTGSLPTFVDMGNNFGGSAILEDSIVKQLQLANKTIAFVGDDTWLSVFPTSFHPNLTFPYDSFNVEDLHTVDTGVHTHLFPLLLNSHPGLPLPSNSNEKQFDFLIGHFLGVDHVGHRVGPSHPSMHAKLTQMDTVLRNVVDLLDHDTLLVVLGDHGMDRAGDHGGDGVLETSSALWIYSKGPPLMDKTLGGVFSGLVRYKTFPDAITPWRAVQQIDLLSTLSLLLGLPIPYNNLGSVIPELFWRTSPKSQAGSASELELERALNLNSRQIRRYLDTYRTSASGSELDSAWPSLQSTWDAISIAPQLSLRNALEAKLVSMVSYNRSALSACRAIWAQFNPVLMATGLALMLTAIITTFFVYAALRLRGAGAGDTFVRSIVPNACKATVAASVAVFTVLYLIGSVLPVGTIGGVPLNALEAALFTGPMMGCVFTVVAVLVRSESGWSSKLIGKGGIFSVLILLLHTVSFFSNSFTFWEDRLMLWLCATAMIPFVLTGVAAPGLSSTSPASSSGSPSSSTKLKKKLTSLWTKLGLTTLRGRILGFTFLFLICTRLMSLVTVCREEQGAYCHVTFYATPSAPSSAPSTAFDLGLETASNIAASPAPMAVVTTSTTPPTWSLFLSLPTALLLPVVITRVLKMTKSDSGIGPVIIWGVVAPALVGSWAFWTLEWVDSGGLRAAGTDNNALLKVVDIIVGTIEGIAGLRTLRSWVARGILAWLGLGMIGWWIIPLCLDIRIRSPPPTSTVSPNVKRQVVILGYANAYGAPYLLFYLLSFALVYLCTPLPGQVVLGLSAVAFVAYLEALDGVRDVKEIERVVGSALDPAIANATAATTNPASQKANEARRQGQEDEASGEPTTFLAMLPLILLSFITFYATGHQSTVSSLQWKTGFVLSESVRYPWSIFSVVLNSAGPFLVLGMVGGGLVGGWKRSPSPTSPLSPSPVTKQAETKPKDGQAGRLGLDISHSALLATLLIQIYFLTLLFGASTSAAVLRRHLMVWKVFAPRFMAAVVELGLVDLGVLVSAWGVVERVVERVGWVLGRVGIGREKEGKEE